MKILAYLLICKIRLILFIFSQTFRKNKIHPLCKISNITNLRIGRNNSIHNAHIRLTEGQLIIGDNCWINYDVEICPADTITIGSGTSVQKRTTINGNVDIGKNCIIAPNVFISSGTHIYDLRPYLTIREQEKFAADNNLAKNYDRPVQIGDDVWVGTNVVIMPGVCIESHVIIGANAVVTKNVLSGQIVAGVPAKIIGQRMMQVK